MTRYIRSLLPVAVLGVTACGGLPDRIDTLEQARESVAAIEREPLAARVASNELEEARLALAAADEAVEERDPLEIVEHHAYVAQRYADISEQRVAEARAREEVTRAESERNRLIAEARAREADARAREADAQARQAAAAEEQAAQAARELEVQSRIAEEQARSASAAEERAQNLEQELEQLEARNTDRGLVLTLGDVLFDTGAATLKAGATTTVDRLAQFMRDYPERSVRIEGHTDSVGSDATNQALSEQRAEAVRDALVARGLDAGRIATMGYGESRPIAGNDSAGGRQQNRRVEIVVSDEQGSFGGEEPRAQLQ